MKSSMPTLETFLTNKPLYYKEIDYTRVHRAYAILKPHIQKPTIIHVVGTNGKGSTGRIMATLLHESGYRVGHYSSPHILRFNERIWIEGADSSDNQLEEAHRLLYPVLGHEMSDALSYFEYTTLLALVAMQELEIIILEAGLGGELDATNVVKKELSVITPIGIDHQAFLGDTIESIATIKLNAMGKKVLVGFQTYFEVYEIAKSIAKKKGAELLLLKELVESKERALVSKITREMGWSEYLYENALLAIEALNCLGLSYDIESLKKVKLFGRFYPLLPNVTIDVGHNLLAAQAIVEALKVKFLDKKPILVYNSLADKDYKSILELFTPYVKRVEIIDIKTARSVELQELLDSLESLKIPHKRFTELDFDENYFVFGSFYVVESFLRLMK